VRVEIRSRGRLRGEVRLVDGRAVGSTPSVRRILDEIVVVEPGTLAVLDPADGERYLRALPAALGGSYLRVAFIE
jgi:hypothetical protein